MKVDILGVKVDNVTYEGALERIEQFLKDGRKHYIVTPNPEIVVLAQKNHELQEILNSADLAIPDGIGLIWAAKILGEHLKERVTGVDLMLKLCELAVKKRWKIGILGGRGDTIFRTAKVLSCKFPKLNLRVFQNNKIDERLNVLFVAFGAPKQEKWIFSNLPKIPVRVAMGVGGAFEMITGIQKRAPKFIQNLGFEWLWRLILQPWRIKRQINLLVFIYLVFKESFGKH